mmetsp:Transcript_42364/g.103810  ORF Transcript_42364/g.103810 Transcript_42364/m.103810 type:complete len:219 (+) Transcript_42364:311-967(+)
MSSTALADSCLSTGFSLASSPQIACKAFSSMAARLPSGWLQMLHRHLSAAMLCLRSLSCWTTKGMTPPMSAREMGSSNRNRLARASSRTGVNSGVLIPPCFCDTASSALTMIRIVCPSATVSTTSSLPSMLCVRMCSVLPDASRTSACSGSSSMKASCSAHPLAHTALRPCRIAQNLPSTCAAPVRTCGSGSARSCFRRATVLISLVLATASPITVMS